MQILSHLSTECSTKWSKSYLDNVQYKFMSGTECVYIPRSDVSRSLMGNIYSHLLLQICSSDLGQHDIVMVDEA